MIDSAGRVVGWSAAAEKLLGFRRDEALGRTCDQVVRCHDLRSQARCASRCAAVESLRTGRPLPTCQILVHDRAGRALGVAESVLLLATGAERRAVLSFVPIPAGVVDPTPWGGDPPGGGWDLARAGPPDLAALLDRLLAATDADAAELFVTAPVGRQLLLASHRGLAPRAFRSITSFEPGSGFPGLVALTAEPLLSFDLADDDRYLRTEVKRRGFRAYVCVPVVHGTELLGSLHIASRARDYDPVSPLPLLAGVARGLATELGLARFRVAESIAGYLPSESNAEGDLWRAADLVLGTLLEQTAAGGGVLLLLDGESRGLEPVVERGASPRGRAPGAAADFTACPALRQRRPVFDCRGPGAGSAGCAARRGEFAATVCLPLEAGGKLLGVAALGWEGADSLPTRHLTFLHGALRNGGVALYHGLVAFQRDRAAGRRQVLPQPTATPDPTAAPAGQGVGAEAADEHGPERPRLTFHCLGRFRILRDGREVPVEAFGRRQPLTLLKILLTHYGRPLSWDQIAEILWPEAVPSNAKALVEQVVHRLRRALEPEAPAGQPSRFVRRAGEGYFFDPGSPHRLDSQEFSEAAALGARLAADGRLEKAREAYLRAAVLYTGDFLEDEPYSDWPGAEREELRERLLDVVRWLIHRYQDDGDIESAIVWCRRGLAVDETREEFHQALMEALWRAGRKDQARRQYHACRAVLERELGVAPSAEAAALYQRIADS